MALPPSIDPSKKNSFNRKRNFIFLILRVGLSLTLAFFISQLKLDYFESYLYDLRVRLTPAPKHSEDLVLITVNPYTVETLKRIPEAQDYERFLTRLHRYQPQTIIFDFSVEEVKGSLSSKKQFADAALKHSELYVLTNDTVVKGQESQLKLPPPYDKMHLFPGPKSADISNFAKDGVTRRMMLSYQESDMLHFYLAKKLNPKLEDPQNISGLFEFLGAQQTFIRFHPTGTYPRYSFVDVIDGKVPIEKLKNKIIIVGQDLQISKLVVLGQENQISEKEYIRTPYSRDVLAMTTMEMHANMLDTLIQNKAPQRARPLVNFIFVAIISLITVYVVFSLKPLFGLAILAATVILICLIGYFSFWPFGYWIAMANPFLAIFLCYYFFIPYRLIVENRRSWEIYQKHKLLQQVEELKTNFISMMSHDLKTPIARIQGMSDIILRESNPLNAAQREAVDTIKHSSDDLLKFINSILSYGKIESEGVQIQTQAKDLNALLDEVIKKHEFLAKLKKIQILREFDPLFPIALDPDLMKQVFSNLVENAIKYSPEETKILVTSEENDGHVIIQVSDQGPGIAPSDQANLFMKFFRTQNAKQSPIKGSGLGLYLAKYFTELHGGTIFVESTYGQGTTFTVKLPISL